jgi:hypothetical protein
MSDNANYRRDFETEGEYRQRVERQAQERATFETDLGKVLEDGPPSPFIVDVGIYTSRRDRDAIQREEDRITRLEQMGR